MKAGILVNPAAGRGRTSGSCAPRADPKDGRLEIVIVRRCAKARLLAVFPRLFRGGHVGHPAVAMLAAEWAGLEVEAPQWINADGQRLRRTGTESVRVTVDRAALPVVRAEPVHLLLCCLLYSAAG